MKRGRLDTAPERTDTCGVRRSRDLRTVAAFCAGAVAALSAQPSEHVHAEGAGETKAVVHRHLDESSHRSEPALGEWHDHDSARFLDPVFTKASKFSIDRPPLEFLGNPTEPDYQYHGHIETPDPHPNRGAPRAPDIPRGPPVMASSAR